MSELAASTKFEVISIRPHWSIGICLVLAIARMHIHATMYKIVAELNTKSLLYIQQKRPPKIG